jgi:hypothetical protein
MAALPDLGFFGDPNLWILGAAAIVVLTILMIYFKVFSGEKRP